MVAIELALVAETMTLSAVVGGVFDFVEMAPSRVHLGELRYSISNHKHRLTVLILNGYC